MEWRYAVNALAGIVEPVASMARHVAAHDAHRIDLFRTMWRTPAFDDTQYATVRTFLDQQEGRPPLKGTYLGRWNTLVKIIKELLDAEKTGAEPARFAVREHEILAIETCYPWRWAPSKGYQHTAHALLLLNPP